MTANLGAIVDLADPARDALIVIGGGKAEERWSFAGIAGRVAATAHRLNGYGLAPGDRVATLAGNGADAIVAFLGIAAAGLVACPLNPRLSPEVIGDTLDDCGARLVLADDVAGVTGRAAASIADMTAPGAAAPITPVADDALACILYTSGSTGKPKGVPLTHAGWRWGIARYEFGRATALQDRPLVAAPLYHMNALGTLLINLHLGATSVLMRRWQPDEAAAALTAHGVTEITGVPTMVAQMLQARDRGVTFDGTGIATIGIGSAPLGEPLRRAIDETFPNARLINGYGTTETGIVAFADHPEGLPTPPLSLGVPHPDVEWRMEDGVLWLRTGMTTTGYWQRPDLTAERFRDGWFCTNDRMRVAENGFFFFEGRADDMFVCGGNNLYPAAIEAAVERVAGVAQAVVVAVPDETLGAIPVAAIVARGATPSLDAVQSEVRRTVAPYAIPRRLMILDAMPLAATAKIDRRAVIALAEREQVEL